MKKFLKKTEGFTLVELIVVIAILGILTAIAVPTYSGYVKKAGEAADTQALSALNTAVAAALTENDIERNQTNVGANLVFTVTNPENVKGCRVAVTAGTGAKAADVLADFTTYYGAAAEDFDYYKDIEVGSDGNLVGFAAVQADETED